MSEEPQNNQQTTSAGFQPLRNTNKESSSKDKMIEGSAWMTAGSIFSRILGAIYIIPWVIWFGSMSDNANALFAKGYNIYSFFLIAAIAGIPSAIAKQVAHYNTINEFAVGQRLYKRGLLLSGATGIICALILYFGAPVLSSGDVNVIPILHSLAWAVLVIPTMSLTRGFFQGYQEMAPSAISQFVEQLARVVYMLVTAFLIMKVQHGNWVSAVSQSTFAAFIGAIGGMLVLVFYYLRHRSRLRELAQNSKQELAIPTKQLYKEIIAQATPFIIIGSAITIFQLIDQYSFFSIMNHVFNYSTSLVNTLYADFAFNSNKLVMIVVSLGSAMAITAVPMLSEAKTRGDKREINSQITDALLLFAFFMIPAALGMAAVAQPLNTLFYHYDVVGTSILEVSAYVSVILGLFTVISAIMQGVSENVRAVAYFAIGVVVKLVLQYPLVAYLGAMGPILSTGIGFCVVSWLILRHLNQEYGIGFKRMSKPISGILGFSLLTFIVAFAVVRLAYLFLDPYSKMIAVVVCVLAACLGGFVYLYATLKTRLADFMLGSRVEQIRRLLRIH
ncbi:polysaccharide biosynthesis protein [Pediococcus inopinatus]|uniref:Polysaccharide biosynthesis protein n=1 Tax=Pediococcus inopinatus TaxID=114090 RepID=A0ABZ0Q605_9LACO|nr:polysaccharide biosynthesis protein [Pediococcus inopinatus]WPC18803.1 polysaccharide biosynthesis protein [Pediococcus inopinatus]WPC22421.1 polysaccharide biosynthesis protein [Pediococcus inopinatus]WPP08650.1 polysaccharide biosynthesis protein [Pediococcus inopinatus]